MLVIISFSKINVGWYLMKEVEHKIGSMVKIEELRIES